MATAGHRRRHQHHPPVHLQLILLILCSCPAPARPSPITIVLSHPHAESPLTPTGAGDRNGTVSDSFAASTAENTLTSTTEIFHGNNSDSDNDNHFSRPAAAPSTALVKTRARAQATILPRQEFYLQDKRTGNSASATTTSAKHILEILDGHGNGGVGNVSIRHGYGYGFGYGPGSGSGVADGDDYGQYGDRIVIRIDDDDGATYRVRKLPVVNSPFQFGLLVVILLISLTANGCVIVNVSKDSLKLKMTHFLLIRHVCLTDFLGTLFILPLPMVAIVRGEWTESATSNRICAVVSTTTALFWTMHLIAVALYRTDRVLAVWLPSGRYPICSVRSVHICLVSVWLTAIVGSCLATFTFGYTFQPALALCIPDVPIIFFIVVFSGYCFGLIALSTGYILAFARKRKRRRRSKKEMLQAQMAAAVGVAQRCLLYATTGAGGGTVSTPPPPLCANHNSLSLTTPVSNNVNTNAALAEQQRQEEAFTLRSDESYDSPFVVLANHSGGGGGVGGRGRVVNVLQHQMTGFSNDFVPPAPLDGGGSPAVQENAGDGDFYTSIKCIRNSDPDTDPDPDDPDKTPTPAVHAQTAPQFGFSGNVNALPSCTITPNRPSPLVFPEPADDASTADSAEESAATPTGPPPPPQPQQQPPEEEPAVKCPHHFLEQGYQVLRSSSSEVSSISSSSESSDSEAAGSGGSSSRMLPGGEGGDESGSDKKRILRKKKLTGGARARIARITHQSFSLTFSNTNSASAASAPGRVKSAGSGARADGRRFAQAWRGPTHSKSFDCYYDLLEQRFDGVGDGYGEETQTQTCGVRVNQLGVDRPHSVHVPMDPDAGNVNFGQEDLEMALVQMQEPQPRSGSRQSRASGSGWSRRVPTPIVLNPDMDAGEDADAGVDGSVSRPRSSESSSKCSSACVYNRNGNGSGTGNGNGTYSNSLNTQDGDEEDHSPYIDVIHDQIDHFRFHVHSSHGSRSGHRPRSASSEKGTYILHHRLESAKGKGKERRGHKHGHHHTRQHHKHAKKSSDAKKRALLSYALSVGHLLLYLPAMFVVGLQGASLPPGAALFCGIVVYCEFLIQPAALMILSHRLRTEIIRMIRRQPSTLAITADAERKRSRGAINQLI